MTNYLIFFWTHFCARQLLGGSFSALHTKSVATPDLVGPTVTRPVQDSLAVLLLDNQLCILTNSLKEQVSFENTSVEDNPVRTRPVPA